jgi:hypothetical protein
MVFSLVGDPKTALTIVSHRAFLKFIPVMSDIQRMDAQIQWAISNNVNQVKIFF